MTPPKLPAALLSLLALSTPLYALSSHSPQDLFAFPRFSVVLKQEGVLNDTVPDLLREHKEAASSLVVAHPPAVHLLRTPAGQAFLCTVPAVREDVGQADRHEADQLEREAARERGLERGLALLEPMRGGCLYQKQSWFTYSFCYGAEIRQFHEVRVVGSPGPSEDPHADSYTLGQAPEPVSPVPPKYGSGSGLLAKKEQRIPATLGGGNEMGFGWDDGGRYLSQIWEDGTICDKTGMPRTVEVQFHCNTQTIDRIALIRETAICRYVMIIHTPRLCSEPVFLEGRDSSAEPSNMIECQPVVNKLRSSVDPPSPETPAAPLAAPPVTVEAPTTAGAAGSSEEQGGSPAGAEVVTLVYDPETGEMLSAQTEDGLEVLSEQELKAALTGDDGTQEEISVESVKELGNLARMMRETIAEALRGVVAEGQAGERAAAADEPNGDEPVVINGVQIQGLADMVAAIARGEGQGKGATAAEKKRPQQHPGLHAYSKKLSERLAQVKEAGVVGSEEHERLKKGFGAVYREQEEERKEEQKERKRDEL